MSAYSYICFTCEYTNIIFSLSVLSSLCWNQVALTGTQIWWTSDVGMAFARLEEGYNNAMKEYYRKQVSQLNSLISMLIGQLTPGDRQKVMTICTIDVHARDVVAKMIAQKVRGDINSYKEVTVFFQKLLPVGNALKIFKQSVSFA